jgi:NAD(P)-dependent dehydrogenase (short-subunit alcohol dehydrogenase family)
MMHATVRQLVESQPPLGRLGQPEDIVNVAIYLASEESGWMTGGMFPIDGGRTAQ